MNKIYIVASASGTYFSSFLKFFTRSKYVHISIALDKDLKSLYSFGRRTKYMFPAGFTNENVNHMLTIFENITCQIYSLEISDLEYENLTDLIDYYINNSEYFKYNVRGLLFIYLNLPYKRKRHFVCSQFCGKLLSDSGIVNFNKDYSIIKPKDILSIDKLNLIYEGYLEDYLK